uniref:Uncharacterized protein n=1 Tax=Arundo donax TaxID=35708 RepID=A0A0A8ZY65_ARUDO
MTRSMISFPSASGFSISSAHRSAMKNSAWISIGYPYTPILRSIMQQPSAQRRVGKVSKPSARHWFMMRRMPFWHMGVSARVTSPVDLV